MPGASQPSHRPILCVIRGTGDIGSAVAHHLFQSAMAVVLHDSRAPTATRRGMAFTDAIFDGRATLAGVDALRVDDVEALRALLGERTAIPVAAIEITAVCQVLMPAVLIDARMRKRAQPESQGHLARIVIGLGPNFTAGDNCDVVVETSWEDLGRVRTQGAALAFAGEPRELGGHARDRYVYAPVSGVLRTKHQIGDTVRAGEPIATVAGRELLAPLDGVVRGLTHDGVPVSIGTKVIEIDPRHRRAEVAGITERPRRIAEGVLAAIQSAARRA